MTATPGIITVGELLHRIWASYRRAFEDRLAELEARPGGRVVPEAAFATDSGEMAQVGHTHLPARLDLCRVEAGRVTEAVRIAATELLVFDPVEFVWGKRLSVALSPFTWDACALRFDPPAEPPLETLVAWYRRWFDEGDARSPTNVFPGNVVHSMSDPLQQGDAWWVILDLGSARLPALSELLDALAETGMKRVALTRPPAEDLPTV
jgi:hypothetical protein